MQSPGSILSPDRIAVMQVRKLGTYNNDAMSVDRIVQELQSEDPLLLLLAYKPQGVLKAPSTSGE